MAWNIPNDLKYAESDEWFRVEADIVTIGISDYAQDQLSDIVYVEFPEVGESFPAGASFGVLESVKAAAELYTVVGGTVIEVNTTLVDEPEKVNNDPYGEGWLIKLRVTDTSPLDKLMAGPAYTEYCTNRA